MVMSYGPNDRNFPGLDRIFPEGKIRRIRGENPVSSPNVALKLLREKSGQYDGKIQLAHGSLIVARKQEGFR